MKQYRVDAHAAVDADIEAAFDWYEDVIVIVAVLHTARDPAEWQLRID